MNTSPVAREYAKALFMLASRNRTIDQVSEELDAVTRLVESDPRLKNFLLAPSLSTEARMESVGRALQGRVGQDLYRFMMVLISKRRQDSLAQINIAYRDELDRHYNRIEVAVESAVELTEPERESLVKRLSKQLERQVVLHSSINPRLLGGLVCRIGDTVFDGSLRRRFQLLAEQMLKAKI